jgi:hypothetical protein
MPGTCWSWTMAGEQVVTCQGPTLAWASDSHTTVRLVDCRVGFIDFGIVGTIAPSSWQAIQVQACENSSIWFGKSSSP